MARPRRSAPEHAVWTVVVGAVLLLALATLVTATALATALRDLRPDQALALVPTDARALAKRADITLLTTDITLAKMASARADALAALSHDATIPAAWRIMGMTEVNKSPRAEALLGFAQSLSRRDTTTQLILLENEVNKGNIVGALDHYDIVLRTSNDYDNVLFPVLAGAVSEPSIQAALAAKLVDAPLWRRRFLSYLVNSGSGYAAQADIFTALRKRGALADRDIAVASTTNSMNAGEYEAGRRLYSILAPGQSRRLLRNGQFEQDGNVPPFDWQLVTDGTLNVAFSGAAGARRLEIASSRGDGARAARQFLALSPGRYRVYASFGQIEGQPVGLPFLSLTCARGGTEIASAEGASQGKQFGAVVTITTACPEQWLDLGLRQDAAGSPTAVWIDGVTVDQVAPDRLRAP